MFELLHDRQHEGLTRHALPELPSVDEYDNWDEDRWFDLQKDAQAVNVSASEYLASNHK
jgi:hypothetical protein